MFARFYDCPLEDPRTLSFHYVSMLYCRIAPTPSLSRKSNLARWWHFFSDISLPGPNKRFPQVASQRLYYARHTRGTPQPLSGRELPIFLAITRACKPELAEYVRRFLTPTSPFYAVEARGENVNFSPTPSRKVFDSRPLLSFSPSFFFSSSTRASAFSFALL